MFKGKHFFGQPVYGQLIKCLNKDKIVEIGRNHGGERYIKSFDGGISCLQHILERVLKPSLQLLSGALLPGSRNLPAR